ncbi:hypothetical protein WG66_002895, partial [Moniliophthora roreri]
MASNLDETLVQVLVNSDHRLVSLISEPHVIVSAKPRRTRAF